MGINKTIIILKMLAISRLAWNVTLNYLRLELQYSPPNLFVAGSVVCFNAKSDLAGKKTSFRLASPSGLFWFGFDFNVVERDVGEWREIMG